MADEYTRELGMHVRSLRNARGLTQAVLAQRSGVAVDTVRRVEKGSFSASIDTLRKLCAGLDLQPSTLFASLELGHHDNRRELIDLLAGRSPNEIARLTRLMRVLLAEIDELVVEDDAEP